MNVMQDIEADYVIIGAGASGMAFADVVLSESDASIIIIDKEHKPGGHWNHAYSFVTLHQPSSFYGVPSKELSRGLKDQSGLNKGFLQLASGDEIKAYYDDLMREVFLPSGRVQYFPMHEYLENGQARSLLTGETFEVICKRKMIDSTYFQTSVPATHTPVYDVNEGVNLIPPNALPNLSQPPEGITIVGGGKTGIDTCIWLLQHGIKPENITWIMPRDAWFLDRANTQPSNEFFAQTMGAQASQMEAIASSTSMQDMFLRLEKAGVLLRLDGSIAPKMFHGATISQAELALIRRVPNIVRLGRVKAISARRVQLEQGDIDVATPQLYVDCTASAITNKEITPVFTKDTIRIQTVRAYQPTFSAALIAYVELNYTSLEQQNKLCNVVRLPDKVEDWVDMTYRNMMNQFFWSKEPRLKKWIKHNRLDGFMILVSGVRFYEFSRLSILNRLRKAAKPAVAKLKEYRTQIEAAINDK